MVCLGNVCINTLQKGDEDDDEDDDNNNNIMLRVVSVAKDKCLLSWLERLQAKLRPRWRMDVRRIGCGVD
jgi:hypothetical protein